MERRRQAGFIAARIDRAPRVFTGPALVLMGLALGLAACEREVVAPWSEGCDATRVSPVAISLEPGESMGLGVSDRLCLEFVGVASEYVVAYLDDRWIHTERTSLPGPIPDSFAVELGGIQRPIGPASSQTSAPRPDHHPPIDVTNLAPELGAAGAVGTSRSPTARETPWQVGESTEIIDPVTSRVRPIRIEQIHDDYLVVASIADIEMPTLDWTLAQIDSAREMLSEVGLPMLQEALPGPLPLTSTGSEQILLVIHPELREIRGAVGTLFRYGADEGFRAVATITPNVPDSRRTPVSLSDLIVHELAHAFQGRHQYEVDGRLESFPIWAWEGGAVLFQKEYSRRLAGIGLFDNHDWRERSGTPAERRVGELAPPSSGHMVRGYGRTAGFLEDQVRRRIVAGADEATAIREVSQAVVFGWRGFLREYPREAEDAILTWVLSRAADDLTDSPVYQNQTYLNAWDVREGEPGWSEEARFVVGQSRAHRSEHDPGSAGYVRLHVSQVGGIVGLTSTTRIGWKLLRVR